MMSAIESGANICVGLGVAFATPVQYAQESLL